MRKWILSLCCLALATPAWAQGTSLVHDAGLLPVSHIMRGPACCVDTCPKKTCVSVPTTITHTRVVFASKCVEYCLPKCSLQRGCDASCADNCGPVRTKNVLLKRVIVDECPGTKCVPGYAAPAPCPVKCATPCPSKCVAPCTVKCAAPACSTSRLRSFLCNNHCTTAAAPCVETIPMPPAKK